jgi:hypothetical protein
MMEMEMGLRRRTVNTSVSIDVDLDEFSDEQILQYMVETKWLTEDEANSLKKRKRAGSAENVFATSGIDEFVIANDYIRRGMRGEALIHLERFLGHDWYGKLQS